MKLKSLVASMSLVALSNQVFAEVISVEITNLTHGSYFTPLLFTAHAGDTHLFKAGQAASAELQAMAEGGSIDGLLTVAGTIGADTAADPAEGVLAPGNSTAVNAWDTGDNASLSITAMILPSNDGFVGLDAWRIPSTPGSYTIYLNAYDAGTEANDEIVNGAGDPGAPGIPANPGMDSGTGGTGVTSAESNTSVHIHRGVVGDTDPEAGVSDLDSRIHRWLNPIAKVTVTVE
jgi:hypothetical protein